MDEVPGYAGYVAGYLRINRNTSLYLYIGQAGQKQDASWNGGGAGLPTCNKGYGTGGGGSTDLRIINGVWSAPTSLRSRILAAGGGGGASYYAYTGYPWPRVIGNGGNGGGINGYDGQYYYPDGKVDGWTSERYGYSYINMYYGRGGNQIAGGASTGGKTGYYEGISDAGEFGLGGNASEGEAPNGSQLCGAAGGGAGWYGGASSVRTGWGAGGGSSYISGHTGSVGVTSTSDSSPKSGCTTGTTNNACSLTPYINPATGTSYTFTNTLMIDGAGYKWTNTKQGLQQMPNPNGGYYASGVGHSGNGAARITYLGTAI